MTRSYGKLIYQIKNETFQIITGYATGTNFIKSNHLKVRE